MEQLLELLMQIEELAGAGIDALEQAMGAEGGGEAAPEGAMPAEGVMPAEGEAPAPEQAMA